jgi:uncharacterized protein (TIGR03435 family)
MTGLKGVYDLTIAYMTEETIANAPGPSDVGVFDAVLNMDLKLELQRTNVDVLVVDHIGKPSAN